ncbi:Uma2 family endonuclease [Actinokineospora sp. HBU206404]|uniref:Uma2 family endonuclease n=2 Tax=Actinokineospora xionganensis TaxID=2684470 RepID=A0ABR7L456_9PSEU|nr:Uma2 family endonuclease [Actinokineospora xionganensis]
MDPPIDGSRLELLWGHLHMRPAPAGQHQTAAVNLLFIVKQALRAADRSDLFVANAVNVRISTAWRTALIPDVVVLTRKPVGVSFDAEELVLAVEIWSPGNRRVERETKMAAYAAAGVPFLWTIDQGDELRGWSLVAYRLAEGRYVEENTIQAYKPATITASPVSIKLDLNELD